MPGSYISGVSGRTCSGPFRRLWPIAVEWVGPYYDSVHLFETCVWMLRLDPAVRPNPFWLRRSHTMRSVTFPAAPSTDEAAGAWDDVAYNQRHTRRSADVVCAWLREQNMAPEFIAAAELPVLEHEFGGSPQGDLAQAADSLSFLDVNADLVAGWVANGETSMENAIKSLIGCTNAFACHAGASSLARCTNARSSHSGRPWPL